MNELICEYWKLDRRFWYVRVEGNRSPFIAVIDDFGMLTETDYCEAAHE